MRIRLIFFFFFFFQKLDGSIDSDTKCFELRNKKIV